MILCYADVHLRDTGSFFPYNVIDSNGLSKELNNIVKGFRFIADQILLHKPKLVVGLGDYFQVTEYITTQTLFGAHLALDMVKAACDEVGAKHIALNGNHDTLSESHNELQYTVTSIHQFKGYFDLYTDLSYFDYDDNLRISLVPHCSNDGKLYKWFLDAQANSDLMLAHFNAQGCMYESGVKSESHISPNFTKPCIAGDIHLPQDIGAVSYVGSLVQHKFYQPNLDRVGGILLYDPTSKKVTRVQNTYSKHYIKVYDKPGLILPSPDRALIQFVTSKNKEATAELLKGYDYMHIQEIKQTNEMKTEYSSFSLADPKSILRSFISEDRPDVLGDFDDVLKEN